MKYLFILSAFILSQSSFAQTVLGTGCDQTSSVVQINRARTAINVSFSKFKVSHNGAALDRSTCNLALPVMVPAGKKLVIYKITIKESYKLSPHSKVKLAVSAFFPGQPGETLAQTLSNDSGQVVLSKKVRVVSGCGESTIVRFNSSLTMMSEQGAYHSDKASISSVGLALKFVDC